jgi:Fe(3+) dicitrate transport protein
MRETLLSPLRISLFVENQFSNSKFSVTPGVRYEYISSNGSGRFGVKDG